MKDLERAQILIANHPEYEREIKTTLRFLVRAWPDHGCGKSLKIVKNLEEFLAKIGKGDANETKLVMDLQNFAINLANVSVEEIREIEKLVQLDEDD